MLILACDTSTDYATFAVGTGDGTLIQDVTFKHSRDLSQRFYASLEELLRKSRLTFAGIDVLAVGAGPGSFTGVRVAVTTFKTLAQVSGKHLVGVGTLDIYAKDAETDSFADIVAVLPSRKGELYYAHFVDGAIKAPPTVATFEKFEALLGGIGAETIICGQTGSLPDLFGRYTLCEQKAPPAGAFIQLAAEAVADGAFSNPLTLAPIYAAAPSISLHKNR